LEQEKDRKTIKIANDLFGYFLSTPGRVINVIRQTLTDCAEVSKLRYGMMKEVSLDPDHDQREI
jgi:hypothetical protein